MLPQLLPALPDMAGEVRKLLDQVPPGRVTTFGDIAEALGDLAAARWVATELQDEGLAASPWQRVIRRTREIASNDSRRADSQRALLTREGCPMDADGRVSATALWADFDTEQPLRRLADWQATTALKVRCDQHVDLPAVVAGVDLSYCSPQDAVAAYVEIDTAAHAVVAEHTCQFPTPFPYISGYLTFRELPPLLQLLAEVRQRRSLAEVILVDGAGRLHPRRFGIAASLGLLAGCLTIGVAKSRLCGEVRDKPVLPAGRAIVHGDEWLGIADDGGWGARRTLYLSPGCGIDVRSTADIVRRVWIDRRGPLPTVLADRLSRRVARELSSPA